MENINPNVIINVLGWVGSAAVILVGLRVTMATQAAAIANQAKQTEHLADEIKLFRQTLIVITSRIDKNENDVAFLRGRDEGRRQERERSE